MLALFCSPSTGLMYVLYSGLPSYELPSIKVEWWVVCLYVRFFTFTPWSLISPENQNSTVRPRVHSGKIVSWRNYLSPEVKKVKLPVTSFVSRKRFPRYRTSPQFVSLCTGQRLCSFCSCRETVKYWILVIYEDHNICPRLSTWTEFKLESQHYSDETNICFQV